MPSTFHPGDGTPPPATDHADGPGPRPRDQSQRPQWTLLTKHAHVLLVVAGSPDALVSEIAGSVGITGRATLSILKDLETVGYLTRQRVGRRSHYTVDPHRRFHHPATATHEIGELLAVFAPAPSNPAQRRLRNM